MKKFRSLFAILLAIGLIMAVAVACDDKTPNDEDTPDYTITVVDEEGNPLEGLTINVCVVINGEVTTCYPAAKITDKDGKAYFNIKKDNLDDENTTVAVHINAGLEPYQSYEEKIMNKGESVTIEVFENILTPEGAGTAEYVVEDEETTNKIDIKAESFSPYKVEGDTTIGTAYKFKFTEEGQKLYIEYNAPLGGYKYKVYSISDVDLKVTELTPVVVTEGENKGELQSLTKEENAKTTQGKELNFEFTSVQTVTPKGVAYLEMELNNPEDLNKEFTLCFVYVGYAD